MAFTGQALNSLITLGTYNSPATPNTGVVPFPNENTGQEQSGGKSLSQQAAEPVSGPAVPAAPWRGRESVFFVLFFLPQDAENLFGWESP